MSRNMLDVSAQLEAALTTAIGYASSDPAYADVCDQLLVAKRDAIRIRAAREEREALKDESREHPDQGCTRPEHHPGGFSAEATCPS